MEIIIILVVLGLAAYWVYDTSQKKKNTESDQPWPYGDKVAEGKVHVKPADVAPGKSAEDRVEAPVPVVTNSTPADNVPVVETKKAPVKKRQFEKKPATPAKAATKKGAHEGNKAPAKKAPAKKKST